MMKTVTSANDKPVVLIVDDEESTRMIAHEFLTQAGFNVAEVANGEEALDNIVSINPDMVLLDVEMPGINGFEACQAIRKLPAFAVTPILMLTGLHDNKSIDLAYDAGATDFATKPINWSLLCYRLRYMYRSSTAERKIHQLAFHDTLTGLANRTLFHERLKESLEKATANRTMLGILYFDLDDFKRINDTFGHSTGDKLLQQVGMRIEKCLADLTGESGSVSTDVTFARMGGDEFTLLLDNLADEQAAVNLAKDIVRVFRDPFQLDGNELFSSPSLGISIFPRDGKSVDTLLTNADLAMYEAKGIGKNCFSMHNCSNDAKILRRHFLSEKMRAALHEDLFLLHYQPQLNLNTRKVFSAEALLRWPDEKNSFISPAEFIPIAEDNGLIVPLGEWVLRSSCKQVKRWKEEGFFIQNVAVNISVLQFMQAGFVDLVASILDETGVAPEQLELEITESLLATNMNNAVKTLHKLKEIGVALSIDDFGTGYSSLSQIKNFPIDRVKIDQSFVRNITVCEEDGAITRAVIALADSLGIQVLAEGVERKEQLDFLRENRCDEIQGYLLCKPASAQHLAQNAAAIISLAEGFFADDGSGADWKQAA